MGLCCFRLFCNCCCGFNMGSGWAAVGGVSVRAGSGRIWMGVGLVFVCLRCFELYLYWFGVGLYWLAVDCGKSWLCG